MTSTTHPRIRVGTYGFAYKEWVGPFYPRGTREAEKLPFYAGVFRAVEMGHTYYGAPKANAVERWRDQTPEDFKIALKLPRWVAARIRGAVRRGSEAGTGARRSARPTSDLSEDVSRLVDVLRPLGPRLGPLVLQLDTNFTYPQGLDALATFLEQWRSAIADEQLAVQFRHRSWFQDRAAEALLRQHDVAWVWNDMEAEDALDENRVPRAIDDPSALRDTSSRILYVRLSGNHVGKENHYTPRRDRREELQRWADLVRQRLQATPSRTAYVMLSDHYAGVGPDTARELQSLLES